MLIRSLPVEPKYKKQNGLWVLDIDDIKIDDFTVKERTMVSIPAGQFGGNHRHPRIEAFLGLTDNLLLCWQDSAGVTHSEQMKELTLYIASSNVPHAVVNKSMNVALLFELSNERQHDVSPVEVYS